HAQRPCLHPPPPPRNSHVAPEATVVDVTVPVSGKRRGGRPFNVPPRISTDAVGSTIPVGPRKVGSVIVPLSVAELKRATALAPIVNGPVCANDPDVAASVLVAFAANVSV